MISRTPPFLVAVLAVLLGAGVPSLPGAAQTAGYADAGGVRLYYELHRPAGPPAEATPVVLVGGLGSGTWQWEQQVPALAAQRPVLVFENRGAGRSEAPPGPYTAAQLADDLAALLDALGLGRVHVAGASLGGFVAQEFALRYPERLDRLVLVATSAGGAAHVPAAPADLALLFATDPDPAAQIRLRLPLAFTEAFLADSAAVVRLVAQRLEHPQSAQGYLAQAAAGATFDAAGRVGRIAAPTFVAHGMADRLVPVANAHRLLEALPEAVLRLYPGGHQFFVEAPEAFNEDLVAFLAGCALP
ncbi:MAG: alpha/beta fold hydrolase [Rubricoccaceae bacterium]